MGDNAALELSGAGVARVDDVGGGWSVGACAAAPLVETGRAGVVATGSEGSVPVCWVGNPVAAVAGGSTLPNEVVPSVVGEGAALVGVVVVGVVVVVAAVVVAVVAVVVVVLVVVVMVVIVVVVVVGQRQLLLPTRRQLAAGA